MQGRHDLPHWLIGYLFLLPLRRLWENPRHLLAPWLKTGDVVLELGPGMGYFSLDLARQVGPTGRLICSEIQPRMREVLLHRVQRAGLASVIDIRSSCPDDPNIDDLTEKVDLAFLHNVLHEVEDPGQIIGKVYRSLKQGGCLYLSEPSGHVSEELFAWEVELIREVGLVEEAHPRTWRQMSRVFRKV
jgi:tRNA A58 N-methylase Trm61